MKTVTFEVYKDSRKEWRWRLRVPNGNIVADSSEGYKRRDFVGKSVARFAEWVKLAKVVVIEK